MPSTKVLIADTEESFIKSFVADIGNEADLQIVGQTRSGEELLTMISTNDPDVVVMAGVLEDMDGLEVLDVLANNVLRPRIIFLSSFANNNIAQIVTNKGADYFMIKPCKINTIFHRIRQLDECSKPGKIVKQQERHFIPDNSDFSGEMEATVTSVLLEVGVPAHLIGYHYLRTAILLSMTDMEIVNSVTKQLYPILAKRYKTTTDRIERSMRHCIEVAWDRAKKDVEQRYFGYTSDDDERPTNSEFVAMLADHIMIQRRFDVEKVNSRLHKFYL